MRSPTLLLSVACLAVMSCKSPTQSCAALVPARISVSVNNVPTTSLHVFDLANLQLQQLDVIAATGDSLWITIPAHWTSSDPHVFEIYNNTSDYFPDAGRALLVGTATITGKANCSQASAEITVTDP